jgi:hypothetical protein
LPAASVRLSGLNVSQPALPPVSVPVTGFQVAVE